MKTLYLIRHAKSSWDFPQLSDFERPLNRRGLRDAPFMGLLLRERGILPDLLLASPSSRTLMTAHFIADSMGYPPDQIATNHAIYECNSPTLLSIIQHLDDSLSSAALFCHNPAITDMANYLSGKSIDNVPTCGTVSIDFQVSSWQHIESGKGEFNFFLYPKKDLKHWF
jgi:phosphohistidine phosphatase